MEKLILPEHLLLLALSDDKGAVVQSSSMALPYGLAGAVVMELSQRKRITIDDKNLELISTEHTGDEVLDAALANIGQSSKTRKAAYWISRPDKLVKGLRQRLLERLVSGGILSAEEHHFLWLIPYHRYPTLDGSAESDMRQRIHDIVLRGAEADETAALLIVLVHVCNLAKEVFPGENAKEIKKALKDFAEGDLVAKAVADQVAAITMMIVTSSVNSAMMTTMISSGR